MLEGISINRSGERRCARLERVARRRPVSKPGVGRQIDMLDGLRQRERRRCRQQNVGRKGDDSADRAAVGGWLVIVGAGRQPLVRSRVSRIARGRGAGLNQTGVRQAGLDRRCRLRGKRMKMPERQRELNEQRKQRQTRAVPGICAEPLHTDRALYRELRHLLHQLLHCNIARSVGSCQR